VKLVIEDIVILSYNRENKIYFGRVFSMSGHKYFICTLSIFFSLFICNLMLAPNIQAAENSEKIVRVGYYEGDYRFQNGFSDEERKSGYAYEYYQNISSLTGWTYEYVYGTRREITEQLLSGKVDIAAGIYKTDKRMGQVLFSAIDMGLDSVPRYFAVNPNRADLLEELDKAMEEIQVMDPKFTTALYQKYYGQNFQIQFLTDSEREYLEKEGSLTFGYVKGNMPFSDIGEDGAPTGVAGVLVSYLSDYLRIPLETTCYDTVVNMESALNSGEIDAAFPIYSDLWLTESKGLFQTNIIISDRVMIVYRGNYRNDLMDKVAISETGLGQQYYLSTYYPESEKIKCRTRADAFDAIQSGEANCMVGCASIVQHFMTLHKEYQNFNVALLDTSENFSIAVRRSDHILAKIMNKAVLRLDDATITNAIVQYSSVEVPYTFLDFIQQYAAAVIAILSCFFIILLLVFIQYRKKTNQFNIEQEKSHAVLADAFKAANAANHAKTLFLSNMSHDIRTPMNGIIGMTAIASAHIDNKVKVEDCLDKIASSSKHLLALINEVLDMSKIESGKVDLNEEFFNFSELMDSLLMMNKPQADAKKQELKVYIMDITHEQIFGDSLRIQQVFTNLVSNAIKYTPEGGKIEVTLSEKPSGSPKLGYYEFTVKDNGIGMSKEYLPHVFEAFTRADESGTNRVQGTGLGMPIARNIVRMMDGDITVESTLGEGSTFTASIFLKLPEKESISREEFLGLNILVVDDDQVICESACLLLDHLGMKGEWVLTGQEAIEKVEARHLEKNDYFAVLLDWQMPNMDGLETTREIRKRIGEDVPLVVISAYDWISIEEEATAAGVNAFVGKPLFKSRLIRLFDELLGCGDIKEEPGIKDLTEQTDLTGKRALLAEDNEINAEIAMEILGMTGLEIEWAHDGKEALEMMERSDSGYYNCIFMDVQMPVMNGLEATRAIRNLQHPDAKSIPIFAMTANVFADDVVEAMSAGMNEHIAKPLNFDILMQILNKYLC